MKKFIIGLLILSSSVSHANEELAKEMLDDCWVEALVLFEFAAARANRGDFMPQKLFKNKQVRCLGKQERYEKKYKKKYVKPTPNGQGIYYREFYSGK